MFRNMVTSLLGHEKITTTDAKAKEIRPIVEKMITLGKKGDLHAMRQAASYIRDKKVVTKLFTTIAPRYQERLGGYTRIVKLGIRPGDNAPLSLIELVEERLESKPASKPTKKGSSTVKAKAPKAQATSGPVEGVAEKVAANPAVPESAEAPKTVVKEGGEECEAVAD
jgi:large subunit ribosomal protein L17